MTDTQGPYADKCFSCNKNIHGEVILYTALSLESSNEDVKRAINCSYSKEIYFM